MPAVVFHPAARDELNAAAIYYEQNRPGLGERFVDIIEDGIRQIKASPEMWSKIHGEVRRCLVPRFPYGIIYIIQEEIIFVLAVMHLRRKPEYWLRRLKEK